jgi:hypothetical protein
VSMGLRLDGLEALIRQLSDEPDAVRADGMVIVREETEGAAADIIQAYPAKTGNLRSRVRTYYPSTTLLVGVVRSAAPHSHLYEFGTVQRKNRYGANRGRMPADKVTPVIAQRRRERMVHRMADMMRRRGYQVTVG